MRPSRHPQRPRRNELPARRTAVVLGGSLAGLLTARVLADHFDQVIVIDRDDLTEDLARPRRGVPQGRHTHGLLVAGAEAIERLLPGFTAALIARGATRADVLARSRWLMGGNVLSNDAPGLIGLLASRTLIESEVRRRVRALPGVELRGGQDVVELMASPDRTRVTGAVIAPRARDISTGTSTRIELPAELVVDATGRGSRAPGWLAALGYQPPAETVVQAGITYVTRLFAAQPGVLDHLDADIVGTMPPNLRAGVALRQEGERWTITLAGMFGEQPPTDLAGFLGYARSLPTSGLAEIIESCVPAGDAATIRYPASRWRRWEKLPSRPAGLIVIGDAVCSFNPVYGQGMSSSALQVEALRDLLAATGDGQLAGEHLSRRAAAAFARVAATPWALATGADRRFPGMPRKPLPERLLDRYVDRLLAVAPSDAAVTMAFGRVLNLLDPPPRLLTPAIAWRVLRPRRSGRPARSAPTSAPAPAGA